MKNLLSLTVFSGMIAGLLFVESASVAEAGGSIPKVGYSCVQQGCTGTNGVTVAVWHCSVTPGSFFAFCEEVFGPGECEQGCRVSTSSTPARH